MKSAQRQGQSWGTLGRTMQTSKLSRLFLMGSVVLGCLGCQSGKPSPDTAPNDPWEPLFNGRTLAGWRVQVDGLKLGQDPSHVFSEASILSG